MPTYEFRCPNGHDFEKLYRTISGAEAQAACPECGALAERKMSRAGFSFKGSGFYLTDYGKNAHRAGPDAKAGATPDSGGDAGSGDASSTSGAKEAAPSSSESSAPTPAPVKKADAEAKPASPPPKSGSE